MEDPFNKEDVLQGEMIKTTLHGSTPSLKSPKELVLKGSERILTDSSLLHVLGKAVAMEPTWGGRITFFMIISDSVHGCLS